MIVEKSGGMDETELRGLLVTLAASLFARGYSVGSAGNISVRLPDGYLMTPTNSCLGRLDPARLSRLDADFAHVGGDPPSKEVFMHRAFYRARADAGAVLAELARRLVSGEPKNQEWVSPTLNTTADGSLYLTVLDLAQWARGLNHGLMPDSAGLRSSWTPARLNDGGTYPYGLGWMVADSLMRARRWKREVEAREAARKGG